MAKISSKFVCQECGTVSPQWLGKCPGCGKFGTLVEETDAPEEVVGSIAVPTSKPTALKDIENVKYARISTGIKELDTVLGGGVVPYSIVLIGGDPGIGKSTILTQVSGEIAKTQRVLYVSAEESLSHVKLRCERLSITAENLMVLNECRLEHIEKVAEDYDFIVIDSIQAIYLSSLSGSAGSVGQVKECASRLMRLAKSKHKTVFVIGHVTKDGGLAGPKVLEHIVDTVLYFEGEPQDSLKLLRAVKNRFGSAQEVGVFEMTDVGIKEVSDFSGVFMSENRGAQAGSVVTQSVSGNRVVPVEVQSLISKTVFGMPRRMPIGVDYNRMVLILAVLERRAYLPFFNQDVYVNAMGGIKLTEPSSDLAVCLSLASAVKNTPIEKTTTAFGEVGLTGEVRAVSFAEKRVQNAIKLGFKKVIIPKRNYENVKKYADKITIVPVSFVSQAIKEGLPNATNE
ncbi:MAG: DNA repair protein RadA [Clostridia bacterium]|nr:DNA repair protein RadA [Clostridia bacterium]